jgi:hypothetical protein
LKEYDKAKKMLEELNSRFPGSKYQINAWYLLGRIYRDQKNNEKKNLYVELIRKADPSSNFIPVLLDSAITDSTNKNLSPVGSAVDSLYSRAFKAFKAKNYEETLLLKKENDAKFPGSPLQVNFDYLEALIFGEKGDLKVFQNKLQAIVDNYPGTEIAEQSSKTIMLMKVRNGEAGTEKSATKYTFDPAEDHFYMLLLPKNLDITQVKIAFLNYHKASYPTDGIRVTNSVLGEQYQILVVNNLKNLEFAKAYFQTLQSNKAFFTQLKLDNPEQYLISKSNFQVLISEKSMDNYLTFYKTNYIF